MVTSKKLIAHYRTAAHFYHGLRRSTACFRAEKIGVTYTLAEREKLVEASRCLNRAEALFTEIWSARIGEAVTSETRSGAM